MWTLHARGFCVVLIVFGLRSASADELPKLTTLSDPSARHQFVMRAMLLPFDSPEQVERATRSHRESLLSGRKP